MRINRAGYLITAVFLTAGLLPAPAPAAAVRAIVSMKEFAFSPMSITIRAGDTVRWTYDESSTDPAPNCESIVLQPPSPVTCPGHSTTAADKGGDGRPLWDSGVHRADGFPFEHTFNVAGTYHYICTVHGGAAKNNPLTNMEGDIVVEAQPELIVLGVKSHNKALPATGSDAGLATLGLVSLAIGFAFVRAAPRRAR